MGIQGLLPFLKKIHEQVNVARFKGCTVAIDAYCWLHKGAFSCAEKLALKEDTDQYVYYCMKYINYILTKDIKPIMVFDGCHLESKAGVEKTRRERRELHRKRAAQFLREGKRNEAKECLQKCVDITPQMALKLIQACRDKGVDCIVAPYEADAQLAYLSLSGIAQVIITEDSDLLLFGCDKVIFKMDFFGNGTLIEKRRLNEVLAVESGFYTFEKFRHMCILSGCDYLPSLPGIGLATANKVFKLARQGDIRLLLKKLSTYLKKNITVTDDYVEGFIKADNTFLYQLVFDPLNRLLKPLNPYPTELQGMELKYAGHQISRRMAYQIALGNIDIHTQEAMAYFDPDSFVPKNQTKAKYRYQLSIWDRDYAVKSDSPCKEIQPSSLTLLDSANDDSIIARGRIAPKSKVIKLSHESDDHKHHVLKATDVFDVYGNITSTSPKKSAKKRFFDAVEECSKEEEETTKRRRSTKELNDFDDSNNDCNDENDNLSPLKRSPVKRRNFKYDASNIGEEAFKEGMVPPSKDNDKAESCTKRQSRNIFAITKTAKTGDNLVSAASVKSKYFSTPSPKGSLGKKIKDNVKTPDAAQDTHVPKKETLKPLSLRGMFENLKQKKTAEVDGALSGDQTVKDSSEVERYASRGGKQQTSKRTPSAFSWSKFKFNSSSSSSGNKSTKLHLDTVSVDNDKSDSFTELLINDSHSSTTKSSSYFSSSPSPSTTFVKRKIYSNCLNQQEEIFNVEETSSVKIREKSSTISKQTQSSTDDAHSDVKEIKSQSYESFLKSITSLKGNATNDSSEGPESGYDVESPLPVVDVHIVDESVENPVASSQDSVIDLTQEASQTSNASGTSRSSNSSGRTKCRVSGLSKKKGKKTDVAKADPGQKSIKDLFSKFAFKKDTEPIPTAISTSYSIDSLDESSDEDLSETPVSKSFEISNAAVVRRKLML